MKAEVHFSPERKNRAEVCLQIPIFDLTYYADGAARQVQELLATAECLLRHVGARRLVWEKESVDRRPHGRLRGAGDGAPGAA